MAVVTPGVDIDIVEQGLSTVGTALRRIAIAGVATGGSANDTLHTSDPLAVISAFTSGLLVEGALFAMKNSQRQCAYSLVKVNASVAGYAMAVSKTASGSSTGLMNVSGTPNDSYEVVVVISGDITDVADEDGELQYSLDGGDTYSNLVAIPANGQYPIPGTGLTLEFTTATDYDEADVFSFNCVGPAFTAGDLTTALAALDADGYGYTHLAVVGTGANAAASAALAAALSTHATARAADRQWIRTMMQAKHGLKNGTVTLGGTPTATSAITVSGTPVDPSLSFKIEITTTGGRGAGVFSWWDDGGAGAGTTGVGIAADGVHVLGTTGVTVTFSDNTFTDGNEYTWDPTTETDNDVRVAFLSLENFRINKVAGDIEVESALTEGRKYRRGLLFSVLLKAANDDLADDMGRVRNGTLRGVSALYRDERTSPGLDTAGFVTAGTYRGRPGKYYIYNGNTAAAEGSSFDMAQLVDIMNEACRVTQTYLSELPGERVRTNADGTIDTRDAETIDGQLQSLLDAKLTSFGLVQTLSAKVRRDLSVADTRTIQVTVRLVPFFYIKRASAELGYAKALEETIEEPIAAAA